MTGPAAGAGSRRGLYRNESGGLDNPPRWGDRRYRAGRGSDVRGSDDAHVPDEHDGRNDRASFEKIRTELGFTPDRALEHGVHQVVDAIERGEVTDDENPMVSNIGFPSEAGVTETVQREFEPVTDLLQDGEGGNPAAAGVDEETNDPSAEEKA